MIEVRNLSRYYGDHRAVDDVSFSIEDSQVIGFLGLNGAGKSTTLKVLAGLLSPSTGTVTIDGVDMEGHDVSFRRRIGYLPETPPLHDEMTVTEFLTFTGSLRGMGSADLKRRIPEVVVQCQLGGQEGRVIGELSHGYRKRVGIAQAIIHSPKLIILDEPISGLDPIQIVDMRKVIRGLAQGATVLVSSHNLPEIEQTCDRVLVLKDGALVADDAPGALAARLNTGLSIELTLTGSSDAVSTALDGVDKIEGVEVLRDHGGRVVVRVDMVQDVRETIVQALVGAGLGLRRLEDAKDELEEIFIDLNQGAAA